MATIEKHIDVDVPVRTAYDQWTQFEDFPRFMEGVEGVEQTDDTYLHWVADIAGRKQEWDARIDEQTPDQRIAWTSTSGDTNAGVVTFHKLSDTSSRVMLQVEYEPEGWWGTSGTCRASSPAGSRATSNASRGSSSRTDRRRVPGDRRCRTPEPASPGVSPRGTVTRL